MGNDIKVLTFITREMLRQVKNNLQFVRNISGEDLAGRFTESPKKGETISIRKPTRYVGRTGETYSAEDYLERTVDMVVQSTEGVDITLTNRELMFRLDDIAERVVKPAAESLANKIDRNCLALAYKAVGNAVGAPGTIPTALKTYNQARAKMSWEGTPQDSSHSLLITPDMQVEVVDTLKGLFQDSSAVASQYQTGMMGRAVGAKWYECQNLVTHTVGPLGGSPTYTSGTGPIVTGGWTAAAAARLKAGDVFTIANVYAVNPYTRQSTGSLRQFVVTADFSSDASGNGSVSISPAIVTSGAFQNVNAAPVGGAAITVLGAANAVTPVGFRFHKEAFLFASFDQPNPGGAVQFVRTETDPETGLKIRFIRDWDTVNNKQLNRFDVVYAFGTAFPEFACRVQS